MLGTGVVTLSGLTISNGQVVDADGGAIYNSGKLTVTDCAISGNIATSTGSLGGNGGGIYTAGGATLTVVRSTFSGNNVIYFGGGIYNDGTFTAINCTFSSNNASRGGGIISRFNNGVSSMTLRNCTIANCTASSTSGGSGDGGGGIYAEGGAAAASRGQHDHRRQQ